MTMNIEKIRAELRRLGTCNLLRMAMNQKEAQCILTGLCRYYFRHQGVGFCISELLGHGCRVEKSRLEELSPPQVDETLNQTLTLLSSREPTQSTFIKMGQGFSVFLDEGKSEISIRGEESADRRTSKRSHVKIPIDINPPSGSRSVPGTIQDISKGGIKVKTEVVSSPFKSTDEVWFLVDKEYLKFQGEGRILWTSRAGDAVGIQFIQLDKRSSNSLQEFLGLFLDVPTSDN
jgi:hypothetical protein